MSNFEFENAVARHDVECGAAVDRASVDGGVGHVVGRIEAATLAKPPRHLRQAANDFGGDVYRIDAARRQRRVRLVAAHAAAVTLLAFVRDDESHARRFTDDAAGGLNGTLHDVIDQPSYTDAADFLVIRKREMQRPLEPAPNKLWHEGESNGRETLHVTDAPSVELVANQRRFERVGVPWLTVDRYHVAMTG